MSDPSELFPTHDPEYRRIYEDEAAKVDASEERYDLAEVIRNGVDPGHGALPAEHFYPEADTILASDWLARIKAEAAAEALETWVHEWPTEPGDGTFLWLIAHNGRERAAHIRREAGIEGGDGRG